MQIVWKGNQTAGNLTTPYSLSVLGSVNSNFSGGATVVGTQGPGKVLVILTDGTHELDLISTNALPLDGKFHHVAVTADGTTVHLYIDGQLDANSASETSLSLLPFTPTNPLQIGGIQGNSAAFDGVIDELQIYSRALSGAEISAIASAGSAGQCSSLWFTEQSLNKVGRIDLTGVPVPGFPITLTTPNAMPYGVTVGPDGNVWVPEYGTGNIAVITPSGTITEDPTPLPNPNPTGLPKTGPSNITAGPDGKLWFTEYDVNQVASITTTGTVNEFPTSGTNPNAIAAGPDGNIWFTELNGNMIGKITPSGVLTEYPVPTSTSNPSGITTGPDGNIWFTEWLADKIGVFSPSSPT